MLTRSQLLGTISLAVDLGLGQPLESGLAVCGLATRFADALGASDDLRRRVFYLALVGHVGCTAESQELARLAGDEVLMREHGQLVDWGDRRQAFGFVVGHARRAFPAHAVPLAIARAAAGGAAFRAGAAAVCEAGRLLAARLDLGLDADIDTLFENWNGSGLPHGVRGEAITPAARIVQIAFLATHAQRAYGDEAAVELVRGRAGRQLDPELARCFSRPLLATATGWDATLALAPDDAPADLDAGLEALADFTDLKSPYLHGHSRGVAELAAAAAGDDAVLLRRAGLVHDVGRVAVSAAVWGRRGPLTADDAERIRLHPYHAERILSRAPELKALAAIACLHHERLDGSGYFRGTTDLSREARLLAAADVAHAMGEERPHRAPLDRDERLRQLRAEVTAGRLDAHSVEAVLSALEGRTPRRTATVAGLTPRELEVLRLVARGHAIKAIAHELGIAPKTADAHIQHIYAKIGVSTRAGAALFAMRHGLIEVA